MTAGAEESSWIERVDEKGFNSHLPAPTKRFLSSTTNATLSRRDEIDDTEERTRYNLPRIEVQFVCGHEIRPEFNVSETFQDFFQESIDLVWNQQRRDSDGSDASKNAGSNTNKNVSTIDSTDDFDLYAALSVSSVLDVDRQHWYYPLCNASSPQILATMDVRGYVYIAPTTALENHDRNLPMSSSHHHSMMDHNDHNDNSLTSIQDLLDSLLEKIDSKAVHAFFEQNVCSDLIFFRHKMVEWDDATFPPPSSGQHVKEYQPSSNPHYPNGQQHYNHHHFYDHNLYLLCGGVDDIRFADDDDDQDIDQGFLVFGMLVGVMMVAMLGSELQQYAIMGVQRRYRRAGNAGYANMRQVQATATITREVEMV